MLDRWDGKCTSKGGVCFQCLLDLLGGDKLKVLSFVFSVTANVFVSLLKGPVA